MSIDENHLIEKSKALVWTKFTGYSKMELKILEIYLSKINARDSDSARVEFTLAEFAKAVGVQQLHASQVKKYTDVLQHTMIQVDSGKSKHGFTSMVVFPTATCEQEIDGQYHITLRCNDDLKPVFFNLASSGYTKYRLGATIGMKSKYSILLYSILLDNLHRGRWQMSLQALREQLGVPEDKYHAPRIFYQQVIEKSLKEINENTNCDISVDFGKVTQGQRITGAWFNACRKPEAPEDVQPEEQPEQQPEQQPEEVTPEQELIELFHQSIEPAIGAVFTDTEIKTIIHLTGKNIDTTDNSILVFNVMNYWIEKRDLLVTAKNVKSPKGWFIKAIKENYQ